ncbi:MAG TPA: GtrA family protein [Desulfosporosinus sp.]|nr:GtrA family protein [Desulfosporosinus sp.]
MIPFRDKLGNFKEFLKFGVVGTIGFFADSGVLLLLLHIGLNPYWGRLGSFLVAVSCTWVLNRKFTFNAKKTTTLGTEWTKYLMANSMGAILNYGVYALLLYNVEFVAQWPVLGVAAGSIVGLLANYINSSVFVYGNKHKAM